MTGMEGAAGRRGVVGVVTVLVMAAVPAVALANPPPDGAGSAGPPSAPAATSTKTSAKAAEAEDPVKAAVDAAKAAAEAARQAAEAAKDAAATLARLAPAPAPAPASQAKKKPKGQWTAQLGANLISVTGNASSVTAGLSAVVGGRFDGWATEVKATATYGQTRPEQPGGTPQVTALNADLRLRGDRKVSGPVSAYLAGGLATDHVASIELQGYGEAGASVIWAERKTGDLVRLMVRTDLGFRVTQENQFQYFPIEKNLPNDTIYAPRIAGDFRYALSKTSVFSENVEILPDVVDTRDLRVTSTTLLGAQIAAGLSIQLGFTVRYIGVPAPGKKPTDTQLSAGISVSI